MTAIVVAALLGAPAAAAPSLLTLYTFNSHKMDGSRPQGADLTFINNMLYVATPYGGASNSGGVFRLKPKHASAPLTVPWVESPVFAGATGPSANPQDLTYVVGGVNPIFFTGGSGTYGVSFGGIYQTDLLPHLQSSSFGIHTFAGAPNDGAYPVGPLVVGPTFSQNGAPPYQFTFVGAAAAGGSGGDLIGCGAVYWMASPPTSTLLQQQTWTASILHSFTSATGADGCGPNAMVRDKAGTLYGTTSGGGPDGAGTAFTLTPPATAGQSWIFQTIFTFHTQRPDGSFDGTGPTAGMIVGKDNNLYGTTAAGGAYGLGTVFELKRPAAGQTAWTELTLHEFTGLGLATADGTYPRTGLVQDKAGVLYGVTYQGGSNVNPFGLTYPGAGTIFSLSPPATKNGSWTEALIHIFTGPDGAYPATRPLLFNGTTGTVLLGATSFDTVKAGGTVYRFTP